MNSRSTSYLRTFNNHQPPQQTDWLLGKFLASALCACIVVSACRALLINFDLLGAATLPRDRPIDD